MFREVKNGDDARQAIKQGIDIVADTVKVTLGAKGKNVVLDTQPYAPPLVTNDGVTIARELFLKDPYQNIGAKLAREVASKTNDESGDGTTTATVLFQAIVNEGMKVIANGTDTTALRRGIDKAVAAITESVKSEAVMTNKLNDLIATATISCGDPEIGKLVAGVVSKLGSDGLVTLEDNQDATIVSEFLEGLRLRGGYTFPVFVTNQESQQSVFNNVAVIVTNQSLTVGEEMSRIMETVSISGAKECVIIAQSIDGDALITALMNWQQGKFRALPIRVNAYGELGEGMLRDVAAITGATFIDSAEGKRITDITSEDVGHATKIVATKSETTIITEDEDAKKARAKELKAMLKDARDYEKQSLEERIAKLTTGMATIKVGAALDTERQELKLRVEDAVNATKAALGDGIVAGGGSALYRATRELLGYDEAGVKIVVAACTRPIELMADNSGIKLDRSDYEQIEIPGKAIDFNTGQVVDGIKGGIIDPARVVTSTIKNAASAAIMFLTTEAAVITTEPPKPEQI